MSNPPITDAMLMLEITSYTKPKMTVYCDTDEAAERIIKAFLPESANIYLSEWNDGEYRQIDKF